MLVEWLPQGLKDALGPDVVFWVGYFTNGKHLGWAKDSTSDEEPG